MLETDRSDGLQITDLGQVYTKVDFGTMKDPLTYLYWLIFSCFILGAFFALSFLKTTRYIQSDLPCCSIDNWLFKYNNGN